MVRGSLVWVNLDPARGAEAPKTRPCIVVSRTEANDVSSTVTIVPGAGELCRGLNQPSRSAKATANEDPGYFMKTVNVRDLQKKSSNAWSYPSRIRVVVTRRGKPAAVMVGVEGKKALRSNVQGFKSSTSE